MRPTIRPQPPIRWTESELEVEIEELQKKLDGVQVDADGKTWARSYLKQVLKDRRATLKLLQHRRRQPRKSPPTTRMMPAWPEPQRPRQFQALLHA